MLLIEMGMAPTISFSLIIVAGPLTKLGLAVSPISCGMVAGSCLAGPGLDWVAVLELELGAGCQPLFRFSNSFCTLILISSFI